MENQGPNFKLHDTFRTWKEFNDLLERNERENHEVFVKTGTMYTVKCKNRRCERKTGIPGTTREDLEYVSIRMECHHYGDFQSKSKNKKMK